MPRGTTERGRDSQRRIADALIDLVGDGAPAPTARSLAERAGVSLRLVFHHFGGLEDIYRLAVVRMTVQYVDPLLPVDAQRRLAERVEQTVRQWTSAYESIGPVWRVASAMARSMPSLRDALALADAVLAAHVRVTFSPELNSGAANEVGAAPASADAVFHLLDAALSFEFWDRLRRVQRLSAVRVRSAMTSLVMSLLQEGVGED